MKTYRTLREAAVEYNIKIETLQEMVDQGDFRAVICDDEMAVLEDDVKSYVAKRDVTREQFAHLDGQPIMLSKAARKYGFNPGSLWRWIGKDHIRIIKEDGSRIFLDEADVAYARALADAKGLRSGQSLF